MSNWTKTYHENINGIIFTLLFHIVVFALLNINQFKIKKKYVESVMLIDFMVEPEAITDEAAPPASNQTVNSNETQTTNVASNKALQNENKAIDRDFQEELDRAKKLVQEVSGQLNKEIPTIKDLKMPEEVTEGLSPDSLLKKLYSGDSNIEYFLEKRYHKRLPKPIYLSQYGGRVKVNIVVDRTGTVISAIPINNNGLNIELLSYAKTAALRTKFNENPNAPEKQTGYISYHFIAQ